MRVDFANKLYYLEQKQQKHNYSDYYKNSQTDVSVSPFKRGLNPVYILSLIHFYLNNDLSIGNQIMMYEMIYELVTKTYIGTNLIYMQYKVCLQLNIKWNILITIYFKNFDIEKLMKNSPIRLKSSSKAKLKATCSPSVCNQASQLNCDGSKVRSSMHTIAIKESPQVKRRLQSNFTNEQVKFANEQSYNNLVLRSGSPSNRNAPSKDLQLSAKISSSAKLKPSKSFSNLIKSEFYPLDRHTVLSPQKSFSGQQDLFQQTMPNIISPNKSSLNNERSFIRIQLGKKSQSPTKSISNLVPKTKTMSQTANVGIIGPITTKKVGPIISTRVSPQTKLIKQVHYQVSPKQIQLGRKVKILQGRIGQLHNQKNQVETQLQQVNIRLHYQNNFLRQKLNTYETRRELTESSQKIVGDMNQSNRLQSQFTKYQDNVKNLSHSASQKLIKELQKSEQNEYHQSKQIHSLKKLIFQTEEMLSKEINKSLELLEELAEKQNENQALIKQIRKAKQNWESLEYDLKQINTKNKELLQQNQSISSLNEIITSLEIQKSDLQLNITNMQGQLKSSIYQNSSLQFQINQLHSQSEQSIITRDLLNDLQHNNQLLISAIRTLEVTVKDSEKQIKSLNQQKQQLEQKICELECQLYSTHKDSRNMTSTYEEEVQNLAAKILDVQTQVIQKNTEIQTITSQLEQVSEQLQNVTTLLNSKQQQITSHSMTVKQQQRQIQSLKTKFHQIQGNSSTTSSFYNASKTPSQPCTKCDQLRKTVFRLNNHLNQSRSSILTGKDIPEPLKSY